MAQFSTIIAFFNATLNFGVRALGGDVALLAAVVADLGAAAAAAAARAAAAIGVDEASKRSTTRALRSSSVARLSVRRDRLARHDRAPAPASPTRVASTRALDVDIARDLAERPSAIGAESDCAVRDFADTR